ncbi:MHS family proline/betaine transporter-like MFS transporter [Rhodococcus fascians]|uniref:MFS transporter n=1 Tax=Nocardiaceae TaxID=85025 RepID=UPI002856D1D7|nr:MULTISPECIES: MFS transporter [Rhodococcus]MDR6910740.1 MHS family proline/betaine transporter-like MFS transporter [Rhodococcus sp. 3258]MDR6931893.1 MHS family proline/betaine transporter-like MFS transporter [Rhodococcus fascians]
MTDRTTATTSSNASWTKADHLKARKAAVAGGVGTLIEYYDFSLYGYLAVVVAPLFFPSSDPTTSLLASLAVFATAYLMRPLGGVAFGHVGDRFGRKTALLATLVCMGMASMAMGLLPTHGQVGIWASVLLLSVRLLQGFSAGGEVGGSATFISESAPAHLKATYGAFTPLGSTGGFALAAGVAGLTSALTTDEQLQSWGWRIPFLLALPLTLFCLWARTRVEETHVRAETGGREDHAPIVKLFRRQPVALVQATGISAACNGTAYIGLTYMSIHLTTQLGYSRTTAYWTAFGVIALVALAMPLGGRIADRIGRVRFMAWSLVGFLVLTLPAMSVMHHGILIAAVAYLLVMVNTVGTQVGAYTLLPLLFERDLRFTGVAMGWNLGVVIAGGTAPLAAVWLIDRTGLVLAPAFFVMVCALVGLAALAGVRLRSRVADQHTG